MASKRMNKYDRRHLNNLTAIQRQVDRVFDTACKEAARLGVKIGETSPDRLFSFSDYPITQQEVESLLNGLKTRLSAVIVNGVRSEWSLSNNKNDELCRQVFGDNIGRLSQAQYRRYFSTNGTALDAFLKRKENGLNLSDRVWRYTEAFKSEIELGLDVGIRNGLSAAEMTRELKQWLQRPDTLFRRVRDEHGDLQLSKAAAAFHPGQGVYRSSYKNARRLAATESNIAYRTADYERWQELDFVVGIEICLSNNHTLLGSDGVPHPFTDICDELAGRYPKDFKFTGWHPHCRCHAVSILKTPEEMAEDNRRIMAGEDISETSENTVTDVPEQFHQWAVDNAERAEKSFSVPYFVKDNLKYLPDGYESLYATKMPYDTTAEYQAAMAFNKKNAHFTPEIKENCAELSKVLPVIQGRIMNFTEADGHSVNPNFELGKADYGWNCGTCVPTYLLRRRGFQLTAGKYVHRKGQVYELSQNGLKIWQKSDGTPVDYSDTCIIKHREWEMAQMKDSASKIHSFDIETFVSENTKETGIYMVRLKWKRSGAHFTIAERDTKGNLIYYDPQGGESRWNEKWKSSVKLSECWLMRIDDKLINPQFASVFNRAK